MEAARVVALQPPSSPEWTESQRRLLDVLAVPENRGKPVIEICALAGYKGSSAWSMAMKDDAFASRVAEITGHRRRGAFLPHTEVTLASNPEEEMAQDVWDVRRLKAEFPKHRAPADFIVDFRDVQNVRLRQQIKAYFRLHLPQWKPRSFRNRLDWMKPLLRVLPPDVHVGNIKRQHIEAVVAHSQQLTPNIASYGISHLKSMLHFMATNAAWTGPRPPRFLVLPEDIGRRPDPLPRPVPPDVMELLDALLDQAVTAMESGSKPPILEPVLWDVLLILRRTGMRAEDVCHLKAPDEHGKGGCLDQDSDGYWWIRIEAQDHKTGKEHRIPTKLSDGTVDAIRRQQQRLAHIPDQLGNRLLFRTQEGAFRYSTIHVALRHKLSEHLLHQGRLYSIAPHQFRHTMATEMIEMGVDPYTVKEFLGHESLGMTQKYIKVYLTTLKRRYDEYRAKKPPTFTAVIADTQGQTEIAFGAEEDSGWEEGKVGKLYRSPLPNGMGVCVHLPMLDPCPTPPVCGFCSKLRVEKRHLPLWEMGLESHQRTLELLSNNPVANDRAIQRHRPYLDKAKHIVETVQREGRYDGRIHNQ